MLKNIIFALDLKKKKKGLLARLSYGPALAHATEKLPPEDDKDNDDGTAIGVSALFSATIVIA